MSSKNPVNHCSLLTAHSLLLLHLERMMMLSKMTRVDKKVEQDCRGRRRTSDHGADDRN